MGVRDDWEFEGLRVLAADWPILVSEFPEKSVSNEALQRNLTHLESLMVEAGRNHEKIFIITDIARMRQVAPAGQRTIAAEWLKRNAALARKTSVGGATVSPSAILRGIITAVFWLQPSPTPFFVLATRHEAMAKGIELLQGARVLLSPKLIAYRDKHKLSGRADART